MQNPTNALTPVDQKLLKAFHAVVVDKKLVIQEGIPALPSYVNEWLIRRFFHNGVTTEARQRMRSFVERYLPPQNKKEEIKARLRALGSYKLIDQFSVTVDLRRNRYHLQVPSLDIRDANVDETIVEQHTMLLSGGVWGAGRLLYREDSDTGEMDVFMDQFEPIQISSFDIDLFIEKRATFTVEEWIDVLVLSQGLNPWAYPKLDKKLLLITRLLPMAQANLNMVELAPKGTGKSHVYKNISYYTHVISGGTITAPQLFYNLGDKTAGLLVTNDVVVFDEIQTITFDKPGVITGILKDYMESGSYARGPKKASARASVVMQGNIQMTEANEPRQSIWFRELPRPLQETALISRLHIFLPGWFLPKINVSDVALAQSYGLAADYLSEALHTLRDRYECDRYINRRVKITGTEDIRDEKAVRRTAAGFLRLLFPHLILTDKELRQYCIDPAIRYRQYVRNQLHLMDEEFPAYKLNYELHGLETPLPEEDESETAGENDDLAELAHRLATNTSFDNLD
jgi:ATP-dependent Lon protease